MPNPRNTELAKQLWAVGDPVRLRILRLLPLVEDCGQGNNVSTLTRRLGLSQPTVSHHLRILRQAGLVSYRKMCRDVFYWIDPAASTQLLDEMHGIFTTPPLVATRKEAKAKTKAKTRRKA